MVSEPSTPSRNNRWLPYLLIATGIIMLLFLGRSHAPAIVLAPQPLIPAVRPIEIEHVARPEVRDVVRLEPPVPPVRFFWPVAAFFRMVTGLMVGVILIAAGWIVYSRAARRPSAAAPRGDV